MIGPATNAGETRRARLVFVHAHPDDETLTTGITMAAYAAWGHDVHLLTCTLGEEGEVIPADLAHHGSGRDDTLGAVRREELRTAMAVLGVEHAVLGEDPAHGVASRYRDSGMAGTAGARHQDAFVRADLDEAVALMVDHITALRPDVVVTYDKTGGYAHPDHIQTHRVTVAALAAMSARAREAASGSEAEAEAEAGAGAGAGVGAGAGAGVGVGAGAGVGAEGVSVPVAYCIVTPRSWATQDRSWLQDNVVAVGPNCVVPQQDSPYASSVVGDEVVTHMVEEPSLVEVQSRALAEHRTQVTVYDGYYALSNHLAARLSGREGFARLDPVTGDLLPAAPGAARHTGLLVDAWDRP